MTTETPRTNAEIISNAKKHSGEVVCANFARQLERELTESQERVAVYHGDWQKLRDENAKLKADAAQPNEKS